MVKRSLRTLRVALGVIAVVFVLALATAGAGLFSSVKVLKNLTIGQIDLTRVRDGQYEGYYDGGLVKAKVRVTVADHRIAELVILKHDCGLGRKAESIVKSVVQAQSLAVDTVSGATDSSKVLLKATENALVQGLEPEGAGVQ